MSRKRELVILGIALLLLILFQNTFLKNTVIMGIKPNLVLVGIISAAIFIKVERSVILSCIIGLFQDMMFGRIYGINALIYMYTALIAGLVRNRFLKTNIFSCMLYVFIFSIAAGLSLGLLSFIVNSTIPDISVLLERILIESTVNALISVFIMPFIRALMVKLDLVEIV